MPQRSLTVGTVQVTAVCDVTADFPAPSTRPSPGSRRRRGRPGGGATRTRSAAPTAGGCATGASWSGPASGWCWSTPGSGARGCPAPPGSGRRDGSPEELAAAGVEPDEIDLVVLTHLHLDHIGWNLAWDGDRPRPRFRGPATWSSGPTGSCSPPGATRTTGRRSTAAWPRSSPSGWPSCWTATGSSTTSSAWSTPPGTPRARRACWSAPATTRPCSGATSPTTRPRSASPTGGRAATSSPRWPAATRRRLLDRIETEGMWLAPAHFPPEPFGTVTRAGDGRRWRGPPVTVRAGAAKAPQLPQPPPVAVGLALAHGGGR